MEKWKFIPVTAETIKDLCLDVFDHQTATVIFNAIERFERDQAIRAAGKFYANQKKLKGRELHTAILKDLQKRENFFTVSLSSHIIKHALNAKNEE